MQLMRSRLDRDIIFYVNAIYNYDDNETRLKNDRNQKRKKIKKLF